MADLTTVAQIQQAFYRLLDVQEDDEGLLENGESEGDVALLYLTRGTRAAQRWMIKQGFSGWRKRSTALSWSGADETDGGRYSALPNDFLRAAGDEKRSCLREADNQRWGAQIDETQDDLRGNLFYFKGEQIWLAQSASPPTTLYLDYHYRHPVWTGVVTIDFPLEARALIVANAAFLAKDESWLPGDESLESKISRALRTAQLEAVDICRQTHEPRKFGERPRYGNHW